MTRMGISRIIERLGDLDNGPRSMCGFDMNLTAEIRNKTHHPCGSACCLGGHAALMLNREHLEPEVALAELCEIPLEDAFDLCWPGRNMGELSYHLVTLQDALDVLRHYRDTGHVDWSEVLDRQLKKADDNWERLHASRYDVE